MKPSTLRCLSQGALSLVLFVIASPILTATREKDGRWLHGPPGENPYVEFDGGDGPGQCEGPGLPNYWINTSSRQLVIKDPIFEYSGRGPSLEFAFSFNSEGNDVCYGGGLNRRDSRWREPYESEIWINSSDSYEHFMARTVNLVRPSGQVVSFRIPEGAAYPYEAEPFWGVFDRLIVDENGSQYYEKSTRYTYHYVAVEYPYNDICSSTNKYYRLTQIVDPYGNIVSLSYAASGGVKEVRDSSGRITRFERDGNGYLSRLRAPDGREATFEFNQYGDLMSSLDFAGIQTFYQYAIPQQPQSASALQSLTVEETSVEFTWDWTQVETVKNSRGGVTTWWWDSGDYGKTTPKGEDWAYWRDSDNGLTRGVLMPNGHFRVFQYFTEQNLPLASVVRRDYQEDTYQYAKGQRVFYTWDDQGNLTELMLGDLEHIEPDRVATFAYDAENRLISETNPLGETWSYQWNAKHRLNRITSPSGAVSQLHYDAKGNMDRFTNPNGTVTRYGYDNFGNLKSVTDPLGDVSQFGYDELGLRLVSLTDAQGNITSFAYDANDRLIGLTHPDGATRSYTYKCSAVSSITDENGNVFGLLRDPQLNVTQAVDAMGNAVQMAYDEDRNQISVTDPLGNQVLSAFSKEGWLLQSTDPRQGSIEFGYDEIGNLMTFKDQRGQQTAFSYTHTDQLRSVVDPLGNQVSYLHDKLDRVIEVTNARSQKIGFDYDSDGYLVAKKYASSTRASFEYDATGNLLTSNDDWGTTRFTYDSRGRVTRIQYPSGKQARFAYDPAGNLKSVTYPGGFTVNYAYDSRNRLTTISWPGHVVGFTYDFRGNLLTVNRSNGISSNLSYDKNNRLVSLRHTRGGEDWVDLSFTHDALGNTTQESGTLPLPTFHDPGTLSGVVNQGSQLTQLGEEALTYDPDGNLMRAGSRLTVVSDPENRPTSIRQNGVSTTYTYDGIGRRVAAEQGIWKRYFHYDAYGNLLFETDEEGTVTAAYIYMGGGGSLTARRTGEESTFYHFDSRGSTLALTDSGGEILAAYKYDPFGRVVHQSGSIYNPFTYVGAFGVMDDGDGLFFMRSRYYDASLQRFLQKDPIGLLGGTNLYSYVGNGPVDSIDPLGLAPWEAASGLIEAAKLAPGSTGAAWLQQGFETMRHWKQGQITYTMVSKTIDSSPGIYLAAQYFKTWVAPLLARGGSALAAGSSLPTAGTCAVVGAAAVLGWGVTGMTLESVGEKANLPRVQAAGKWMNNITEKAVETSISAVRNVPYFVRGLGVKLGLVNP